MEEQITADTTQVPTDEELFAILEDDVFGDRSELLDLNNTNNFGCG